MGIRERIGRFLGSTSGAMPRPQAAYFKGEQSPFLVSWRPQLREQQQDIQASWAKSAARAIDAVQNSGFMAGIVEVASGSTVGPGLRMACRVDAEVLGWTQEKASKWSRKVETRFRAWASNPIECDAAGQMTFQQMQQAAFACYMTYGEILALLPMIRRPGAQSLTKVSMLPPSRLVDHNQPVEGWVQGVKVDSWGLPVAYRLRERDQYGTWKETDIRARDNDGRPNVVLIKDPAVGVTRGISPFASVLKVTRQIDQYFDATLTSALIQTIFAATIKSNINGLAAFDGLMTEADSGSLNVEAFGAAKGQWYDGAKIDLTQHGRIAHLFPNDELIFNEAKQPGQQFDHFMGWLLREVARGGGVTYESATGDYRGATYSSVRMAGAVEWLTVLRRRENLVIPFCKQTFDAWLEEEIGSGRIEFDGGYQRFLELRATAIRSTWTGPARPQADDFKTARAYEVRKEMQATTLAEISEEYGRDWDDDMRQRKAENDLADELNLPRPWAPKDMIETPEGQDLALNDPGDGAGEKRDPKRPRKAGERDPAERDPAESSLQAELSEEDAVDGD